MGFGKIKGGGKRPPNGGDAPTKESVLAGTAWIWATTARFHGITPHEHAEHWLRVNAAAASDPFVDHEDSSQSWNVYRRYALAMHANGWSPFPEGREERKPAFLGVESADRRKKTQWSATLTSLRRDRQQLLGSLLSEMDAEGIGGVNAGCVIGPASGNIRPLDIDCTEPVLSAKIVEAAIEIFGPTPYVRIGRAPKTLMLYRVEGADLNIPKIAVRFLGEDGEEDMVKVGKKTSARNAVELLGVGGHFTCFGLHHGTGRSITWPGELNPATGRPEMAPVITGRQIKAFFRRCDEIRTLANWGQGDTGSHPYGGNAEVSMLERVSDNGMWRPKRSRGEWKIDREGYVEDGREAFLSAMVWAYLSANPDYILTRSGALCASAEVYIANRCICDGDARFGTHEKIAAEVRRKFEHARGKWLDSIDQFSRTGQWMAPAIPWRINPDGSRPIAQHVVGSARPDDGSMDWLPEKPVAIAALNATEKMKNIVAGPVKTAEQVAIDKADRALLGDEERALEHIRIAAEIDTAAERFCDSIDGDYSETLPPLNILKAPTGAGKTVRTVFKLGGKMKLSPRKAGMGPVVVALPNHENIAEALLTAQRAGMTVPIPEIEITEEDAVAMLRANGVKAAHFQGKNRLCGRKDELALLTSKGIGTGGLCGASIDDDPELVAKAKRRAGEKVYKLEVLCPIRAAGGCDYFKQMDDMATADIIFVPHAYLTMHNPPKVIRDARAVVIDESTANMMLRFYMMPWEVLRTVRPMPFATKAEMADSGKDQKESCALFEQAREMVLDLTEKAFLAGRDPARDIIAAELQDAVAMALTVVRRQHVDEREINPLLSPDKLAEIAGRENGEWLYEEEKLWRLLLDRIRMIEDGTARGDTDARFQVLFDVDRKGRKTPRALRMSWRAIPNWVNVPMLLLDASASPMITEKTFGREPEVITVEAKLNVRIVAGVERPYSNRSYNPPDGCEDDEIKASEMIIRQSRGIISKMSGVYGNGRVLVGSTMLTRDILTKGAWAPPPNVDMVHFGALRGLDFAKAASAAVSFGRSEQPMAVVDAQAAALTYDDEDPELPADVEGTGMTAKAKPLFRTAMPRLMKLRTGQDLGHMVHQMPTAWGREVETQWREEELRQFLGRLRPVYRNGEPPVWVCLSSSLPGGLVVDELFTMKDMAEGSELWEIFRAEGGIFVTDDPSHPLSRKVLHGRKFQEYALEHFGGRKTYLARATAAMAEVVYHIGDGVQGIGGARHIAKVAAWHDDPAQALQEYYGQRDVQVHVGAVTPAKLTRTAALARKPDRLDLKYAGMDQAAQELYVHDVAERIAATGRTPSPGYLELALRAGFDVEYLARDDEDLDHDHFVQWLEKVNYFHAIEMPSDRYE